MGNTTALMRFLQPHFLDSHTDTQARLDPCSSGHAFAKSDQGPSCELPRTQRGVKPREPATLRCASLLTQHLLENPRPSDAQGLTR